MLNSVNFRPRFVQKRHFYSMFQLTSSGWNWNEEVLIHLTKYEECVQGTWNLQIKFIIILYKLKSLLPNTFPKLVKVSKCIPIMDTLARLLKFKKMRM